MFYLTKKIDSFLWVEQTCFNLKFQSAGAIQNTTEGVVLKYSSDCHTKCWYSAALQYWEQIMFVLCSSTPSPPKQTDKQQNKNNHNKKQWQ